MQARKVILCPVDCSRTSDRAVEQAGLLAHAMGARVELLHVYQLPVLAPLDGMLTMTPDLMTTAPEAVAKRTAGAQDVLETHRGRLAIHGIHASTTLLEGNPVDRILERSKELQACILVLGTHRHGGFKRFVLGSTTEHVVRLAGVPVLIVPLAD